MTFVTEATGQGCDFPPWPTLVRNFYAYAILCDYFQSPELIRFNICPLFHTQGRVRVPRARRSGRILYVSAGAFFMFWFPGNTGIISSSIFFLSITLLLVIFVSVHNRGLVALIFIYFLLYKFQMYNIITQHLYVLQSENPERLVTVP